MVQLEIIPIEVFTFLLASGKMSRGGGGGGSNFWKYGYSFIVASGKMLMGGGVLTSENVGLVL